MSAGRVGLFLVIGLAMACSNNGGESAASDGGISRAGAAGSAGSDGGEADSGVGGTAGSSGSAGRGGSGSGGDTSGSACAPPVGCTTNQGVCEGWGCGSPTTPFDGEGCLRATCTTDETCAADERCISGAMFDGCSPSMLDVCSGGYGDEDCSCLMTADCAGRVHCIKQSELPADTCPIPDYCVEIEGKLQGLGHGVWLTSGTANERLQACQEAHQAQAAALGCE